MAGSQAGSGRDRPPRAGLDPGGREAITKPETVNDTVDLHEAARQLEQAAHDAQVAYDAIGLGDLNSAHTHAIAARAAAARESSTSLSALVTADQDKRPEPRRHAVWRS